MGTILPLPSSPLPSSFFSVLGKGVQKRGCKHHITNEMALYTCLYPAAPRVPGTEGPDEEDGQTVAVLQGTALSREGHPPPKFPEPPPRRDRLVMNQV